MSSTYAAVAPCAEVITFDEFRDLLDDTDSVSIYPGKGQSVRHTFSMRLRTPERCRPFVGYEYLQPGRLHDHRDQQLHDRHLRLLQPGSHRPGHPLKFPLDIPHEKAHNRDMNNTADDGNGMETTTYTIAATATTRPDAEAYTISRNGTIIGYAARRLDAPTFSLNTASGLDLLARPVCLADAVLALTDHDQWATAR